MFVRPRPGVAIEPVREKMYAVYRAFEQERAKSWTNIPKELLVGYPREKLLLHPASFRGLDDSAGLSCPC